MVVRAREDARAIVYDILLKLKGCMGYTGLSASGG